MLVIISDLHLSDGTTGLRTPAGAFELFRERLEDMAYDASQHRDGTYRPIESLDLLLLGDILDPLSTTQWTDEQKGEPGYARPWSRPDDPAFVNKVEKITDRILQQNAEGLEILCRVASGEGISLPPATGDQRADSRSTERLPVRVRLHYMIGNHDWFYHLPGPGWDRVRAKIIRAMGLSNPASPFPYVPSESDLLSNILQQHSVFARHGDYYDPYNLHNRERDHASLSDAVCVELVKRIGVLIHAELVGTLPEEFFLDLDEMGSIRPELMTPVWIASLLDRYQATPLQRKKIDEIWHALIEQFSGLDVLGEFDRPFQFDMVDGLQAVLKFARLVSIENLNEWALAIEDLMTRMGLSGKNNSSYEKFAVQEEAYRSREARFIVYGHTHRFAVTALRSTSRNGLAFDQMYLNAGSWLPVHETCGADSNKKGFIFHKTMGYLGIYQGEERRGKAYETWNGSLDV